MLRILPGHMRPFFGANLANIETEFLPTTRNFAAIFLLESPLQAKVATWRWRSVNAVKMLGRVFMTSVKPKHRPRLHLH